MKITKYNSIAVIGLSLDHNFIKMANGYLYSLTLRTNVFSWSGISRAVVSRASWIK